MPRDKDGFQRKVFMLPTELVDRIAAYQKASNLPSEVEAVRRLLEEALKYRDDWWSLTARVRSRLAETRSLADAARDVLVGHPLVGSMAFGRDSLEFTLTTGDSVIVHADGAMSVSPKVGEVFSAPAFVLDKSGRVSNADLPF